MRILVTALTALMLALPAQAQTWVEAETDNFIIKSQDTEEATRQFAIELERFDMGLRTLQNLPIGEELPTRATKLTVYRFGTVSDIGRMAGAPGVAGFYIPRAGDSVAFTPARGERRRGSMSVTNFDRNRAAEMRLDEVSVLQHEYVHYFMMQHFPAAYPAWYVEGYAELLATMRFNDDGSFFIGDPPVYRSYQVLEMSQFRLEDMLDQEHKLSGRENFQHYGTGWLLTHYLSFNPERLAQLNTYLTAIGAGEDSLTAARRIFGDLRAIDRELLRYRNGPFPGLIVPVPSYDAPEVRMRQLSDAETQLIRHEMELRRGVSKDDAARIARAVRSVAEANPASQEALALLARAELYAENYDAADAAADRLIALAPGNLEGPLYKSYVAIERIEDDPVWADAARQHALAAAALDTNDPRARIAYYYTFVEAEQEPTENAIIALEGAFDHAGSDAGYRVLLSRQLLIENRVDSARQVLMPIAFRGHNQNPDEDDEEADEPSLNKIMAFIAEGNRDAALTMMNELLEDEDEDEDA
jgi:tetratricopeptide (TPR) repeat protein